MTIPLLGIIGGIAPESTIAYYRLLVEGYRRRFPEDYPRIVINSIDLTRLLGFYRSDDRPGLIDFLLVEIDRLARAGAGLGCFASNTPHLVFEEVRRRSPIPLVSIVEATARKAKARGLSRVGLLGTRFTMEGGFYPAVFAREGLAVHSPAAADREYIHRVYLGELVQGEFRPETRAALVAVIGRLVEQSRVEAVILGGTELPLILGPDAGSPVPLLDTTAIHVDAILEALLPPG
jgi:aspartate racemase